MAGHCSKLQLAVATALILSLVSVRTYSQTSFPRLRYSNGTFILPLSNNSVVNFEFLRKGTLQCITDLNSCCLNNENGGARRWFLPNGTKLIEGGIQEISAFIVNAGPQQFELELTDVTAVDDSALSGVYECEIDTLAGRQSVYVGLYNEAASLFVEAVIDFLGIDVPFTLTCISGNRPGTTVGWYLNDERINDPVTTSVLTDPMTSRYTHTLTVNERTGGEYKCVVFTTSDISGITTYGNATIDVYVGSLPTDVGAYQEGPTSVRVFWTPPEPIGQTIGYQIYYTGPTSGNVSFDSVESFRQIVTGLVNGESYQFFVTGTSVHLESEPVAAGGDGKMIGLGPGAPEITLESASGDSLTVSWSVPSGTVVEMYELMWIIEGPQLQPVEIRNTVSSSTHRYSVPVLNMYENVTVVMTVTSVNAVGSSSSSPLTVHSDIIQSGPTSEETINIGAIIGGAVGIFLIGAALGITTAIIITFKYRNKYDRQLSPSHQPPTNSSSDTGRSAQHVSHSDPATSYNMAYHDDDPVATYNRQYHGPTTAPNLAYTAAGGNDLTYDYIS